MWTGRLKISLYHVLRVKVIAQLPAWPQAYPERQSGGCTRILLFAVIKYDFVVATVEALHAYLANKQTPSGYEDIPSPAHEFFFIDCDLARYDTASIEQHRKRARPLLLRCCITSPQKSANFGVK